MSVKSRKRYRAPKPAGTIIVIKAGNRIVDPPKISCSFGSSIAFLIFNLDKVAHSVWIDPAQSVLKKPSKVRANPFSMAMRKVKVQAGDFGVIRQRIRPIRQFESGRLPAGVYKYTISSGNAAGRNARQLDPDVDVTPPPVM